MRKQIKTVNYGLVRLQKDLRDNRENQQITTNTVFQKTNIIKRTIYQVAYR